MNILIDILNQLHVTNYVFLVFLLFVLFFLFIDKIIIQPVLKINIERKSAPSNLVIQTQNIDEETSSLRKKTDEVLHLEKVKVKTEFEKKLKEQNVSFSEEILAYSKAKKDEVEMAKNKIDQETSQIFIGLEKEAEKISDLLLDKLTSTRKGN